MDASQLSPKEFLRARHPERFSDTVVVERPDVDRVRLEFHLDTLTSRKQEVQFERFARRLCEREVCPNLLPQTGPTGGGDSKVDAETYPVADGLSLAWYTGFGREAASERWGFAFSAKKRWKPKLCSDVAKAARTGREYRKVFFVTNQSVPDRKRADAEDQLRNKHGVDVRVLDRTWILDRVFANGHEALANEELELGGAIRTDPQKGPIDAERGRELDELEARIKEASSGTGARARLVYDCIEAAVLSAQLERPRTETDGRFQRAQRVAAKHGTEHQQLECAYQRAWITFWWHEDGEHFSELYVAAEELVKGTTNAYDLELLSNLWFLLHTAVSVHGLDRLAVRFDDRTETLGSELDRVADDEARPSTALRARTLRLQIGLMVAHASDGDVEPYLRGLREVLGRCGGLVGYPLQPFVRALTELGEASHDVTAYDELFEAAVDLAARREEEVAAARMLLKRGEQQLEADRPYDAIRYLGRALGGLYKHESREESVRALYLCGCAYERVGLLWAARGTWLTAASLATDEFWRHGEITRPQAACYERLKWIELQLGRLPHILAWHQVDLAARCALAEQGHDRAPLFENAAAFDGILGMLLLRTDLEALALLPQLPDALDSLALPHASLALLYALGHEGAVRGDADEGAWGPEQLHDLFLKWREQPAVEELPPRPSLCEGRSTTLVSNILGCRLTAESDDVSPCMELAESLLGALESFLSTGTTERLMTREPELTLALRTAERAGRPFQFEVQDRGGRPHVDIVCPPFDPHHMAPEAQDEMRAKLLELLAAVVGRLVAVEDPAQAFATLIGDERALERSLSFTGSFVTVANVLGDRPRTHLSDWLDPEAREYPLVRSEPWDALDASPAAPPRVSSREERAPGSRATWTSARHSEMRAVSPIREALWKRAEWGGVLFAVAEEGPMPPVLALAFKHGDAAHEIFAYWREEFGDCDEEERLRVAVVRGIDKMRPHWYRLLIGPNPDTARSPQGSRLTVLISQVHTMEPTSSRNLDGFIESYQRAGSYLLSAAAWEGGGSQPQLLPECRVLKRALYVRQAWEIGRHDVDASAVVAEDDPVILPGRDDAPVLDLLRTLREGPPSRPQPPTDPPP